MLWSPRTSQKLPRALYRPRDSNGRDGKAFYIFNKSFTRF
jgi:hypothetical protein